MFASPYLQLPGSASSNRHSGGLVSYQWRALRYTSIPVFIANEDALYTLGAVAFSTFSRARFILPKNLSAIFVLSSKSTKLCFLAVTNGTYDVLQSQFEQPCIPASQYNSSINGFNSGPRPTVNGTVITMLEVPITDNTTAIWFYENSTCSQGGVGVINANESSTETLAGYIVSCPLLFSGMEGRMLMGCEAQCREAERHRDELVRAPVRDRAHRRVVGLRRLQ